MTLWESVCNMLEVEGYKMFVGTMMIFPKCDEIQPFPIEGTWLYKPEYDCWYCNGSSYHNDIVHLIEDKTVCKK